MAARILACLFSAMRYDGMDFRELVISAQSVMKHAGGENYKALKTACDKLSVSVLELKTDNKAEMQKYPLFSAIRYANGMIFVKFHPDLKPFFLGVKSKFVKYDLQEFLSLPSIYSQKLFEYLKSWSNCVERTEDLRAIYALLDIPEYARANFKDFRRRILDKAHKDISQLTSLRYEWEAIKKGTGQTSPVMAVRFIFSPDKQAASQKAKREAHNKKIRDERNRLFLESEKCFRDRPGCVTPKRMGQCAVCFKLRALELPKFLQGQLPEYE
jgi:plasmid replication initiation protein